MARSSIEQENDKLVQIWASKQRSIVSGKRGCVGHHIKGRANSLLRWDLRNIAVLTPAEHRDYHDGKLELHIDTDTMEYLEDRMREDFRTWLLFNGMTEKEYIKAKREELRIACA